MSKYVKESLSKERLVRVEPQPDRRHELFEQVAGIDARSGLSRSGPTHDMACAHALLRQSIVALGRADQRAGAGHHPDPLHLPAAEPHRDRPVGWSGGGAGRPAELREPRSS